MQLTIVQIPAQTGAQLMADDEALLRRAEQGHSEVIVRFYEWVEPTISLGYHQDEAILDHERIISGGVPWVRRPTGGAAVLHSEELTYSIILPDAADAIASATVQELVSRAIAGGLRALGVEADVDARGEPLSALPNRSSCFVRTSRWEVTAHGKKIVGSAQRKLTRALLQHGSILTGNDHLRIVDFLRMSGDTERDALRAKLSVKATSIHSELKRSVSICRMREVMAESFLKVFGPIDFQSAEITGNRIA